MDLKHRVTKIVNSRPLLQVTANKPLGARAPAARGRIDTFCQPPGRGHYRAPDRAHTEPQDLDSPAIPKVSLTALVWKRNAPGHESNARGSRSSRDRVIHPAPFAKSRLRGAARPLSPEVRTSLAQANGRGEGSGYSPLRPQSRQTSRSGDALCSPILNPQILDALARPRECAPPARCLGSSIFVLIASAISQDAI